MLFNEKESVALLRTYTPKLNAGDVVIFQSDADGSYDLGMMEVTEGERIAVGLLQPILKTT